MWPFQLQDVPDDELPDGLILGAGLGPDDISDNHWRSHPRLSSSLLNYFDMISTGLIYFISIPSRLASTLTDSPDCSLSAKQICSCLAWPGSWLRSSPVSWSQFVIGLKREGTRDTNVSLDTSSQPNTQLSPGFGLRKSFSSRVSKPNFVWSLPWVTLSDITERKQKWRNKIETAT